MEQRDFGELAKLGQFLDGCAALDRDVELLLTDAWTITTKRQLIGMAFCKAALEHAVSQRLLFGSGQSGTGLALIRLNFETTIRAAWVQFAAKDDWLEAFTAPVADGSLAEPVMGPPIPAMLDTIEKNAPDIAYEGRRLYATVKGMHSFVHGGAHLVVHALRGYPASNLMDVLRNRNMMLIMLCNVILATAGQPRFNASVGRLMRAHAGSMPPLTPGAAIPTPRQEGRS